MNLPTLLVLLVVAALLALVVVYLVRTKRNGGSATCAGCPHAQNCPSAKNGSGHCS